MQQSQKIIGPSNGRINKAVLRRSRVFKMTPVFEGSWYLILTPQKSAKKCHSPKRTCQHAPLKIGCLVQMILSYWNTVVPFFRGRIRYRSFFQICTTFNPRGSMYGIFTYICHTWILWEWPWFEILEVFQLSKAPMGWWPWGQGSHCLVFAPFGGAFGHEGAAGGGAPGGQRAESWTRGHWRPVIYWFT